MIIDSATLLLLSIIFASLSITEKLLYLAVKKKSFLKLKNFISKNKNKIEESIRTNQSMIIDDDNEIQDTIQEIKTIDEVIQITGQIIDLISISNK